MIRIFLQGGPYDNSEVNPDMAAAPSWLNILPRNKFYRYQMTSVDGISFYRYKFMWPWQNKRTLNASGIWGPTLVKHQ